MQGWQNEWPQPLVAGERNTPRHSGHSRAERKLSSASTMGPDARPRSSKASSEGSSAAEPPASSRTAAAPFWPSLPLLGMLLLSFRGAGAKLGRSIIIMMIVAMMTVIRHTPADRLS
jgi:hypothetical protein